MSTILLSTTGISRSGSIWLLTAVLGALYVTYTVLESLYSAYYGPLSRIPGPKLRAISKIPDILSMLRGTKDLEIPELHRKYGPVVRIRPKELSYAAGSEAWKAIYGFKSQAYATPYVAGMEMPCAYE